jgi:beta-glucosidase
VTYLSGDTRADEKAIDKVVAEAKNHDYVLLCLGEQPYTETVGNIESLTLAPEQTDLADAVLATGKPVILLTLGGRPRIITPIANQSASPCTIINRWKTSKAIAITRCILLGTA